MIKILLSRFRCYRATRLRQRMSAQERHRHDVEQEIIALRARGTIIGEGCYISGVSIMHGDPVSIGNRCVLTRCTILAHDASPALFVQELDDEDLLKRRSLVKPTRILDNCFIGVGAIVLCGITVGPDSIVAAGAIVTKNVPEGVIVAGNPARIIGTIERYAKAHLEQFQSNSALYPEP